jgi:hypothetical protein
VLSRLNSTKMVRENDMVGDYDLDPLDYPLEALLHVLNVNKVVERELDFGGTFTKWCCLGWWHRRRCVEI